MYETKMVKEKREREREETCLSFCKASQGIWSDYEISTVKCVSCGRHVLGIGCKQECYRCHILEIAFRKLEHETPCTLLAVNFTNNTLPNEI